MDNTPRLFGRQEAHLFASGESSLTIVARQRDILQAGALMFRAIVTLHL